MAAVELNLNPTDRQLRQFGFIGLVAVPLLGWLFAGKPMPSTWGTANLTTWYGFIAVAGVLGVLAFIKPSLLKWLFVAASVVTFPIGFVLGEIVMFTIYIVAFAPMALLFRIIGRDALQREIAKDATTYWQPKQQAKDASSYYRQS